MGQYDLNFKNVTVDKMVNGGQALAKLADGRYVFIWNALPDEVVNIRVIKTKKNYLEAVAEEIVVKSKLRREPRDSLYLSTSPWQIMSDELELDSKLKIVKELFTSSKINCDLSAINIHQSPKTWFYRNKMEYVFWGDEDGVHLAHYSRDSKHKQIIFGSSLAMPQIDQAAQGLINTLNKDGIRASKLKSVVIRSDQSGTTNLSLFVKEDHFKLSMPQFVSAMKIYYSDPKSPASVFTKLIDEKGHPGLVDKINGLDLNYDADSFFQVNLDIFNQCVKKIESTVANNTKVIDIYGGVGSIGLSVAKKDLEIVEINDNSTKYATINSSLVDFPVKITHLSAEEYISKNKLEGTIIFDPPRAGLNRDVVNAIINSQAKYLVYLSCNPATLARDLSVLQSSFTIDVVNIYNFFPKTPHIESLVYLKRKK